MTQIIIAVLLFFSFMLYLVWKFSVFRKAEMDLLPDEEPETVDEILNEKVSVEGSYAKVEFGGRIIQMSIEEFAQWRLYDRKRKRQWVRDFDKVVKKL